MGEQAQEEPVQPEKQSESLKAFSDVQLLGELEIRLGSNPKVDAEIVQRLETITAELQKRVEAARIPSVDKTEKQAEASVPAPIVGSKLENSVESPVESEGKKWARIIREKGIGVLDGKFRADWEYLGEDGKFRRIVEHTDTGFRTAGAFGIQNASDASLAGEQADRIAYEKLQGTDTIAIEYERGVPSHANFLEIKPLASMKNRFSNGVIIRYVSWLAPGSSPDFPRPGFIPLRFTFVLPQKERQEFLSKLSKNVELIDDVFKNVYPGLTGEKGAKLMKVEKLKVIGPDITYKDYEGGILPVSPFSHPVGTVEWPSSKGKRF